MMKTTSSLPTVHSVRHILFVSHDQHRDPLQLFLLQKLQELSPGVVYPVSVCGVHHVDDRVRVGVVAAPVGTDGGLPT